MKKVICISRNDKFNHHRKLEINKWYLCSYVNGNGGVNIHRSNGVYIGTFNESQFLSQEDWRELQLNNII